VYSLRYQRLFALNEVCAVSDVHPSEDQRVDRVWVWWEGREPRIAFTKPLPRHNAVEYMRVLSRQEVEKLANDFEGVNVQQYINSLIRTIEGQRKHIAQLQTVEHQYHDVMGALRSTKMEHGLCEPVERKACTHCAGQRKLDKMLAEYKGPRITLA